MDNSRVWKNSRNRLITKITKKEKVTKRRRRIRRKRKGTKRRWMKRRNKGITQL